MNVVQKQWNDKADEWMQFARDENSYWSRRLRAIVGLARRHIAAGRSLDVGCGPGLMVRLFTEAGFEAHGADLSENMIDRAAEILAPCVAAPRARLHWCPDGHPPPPPGLHPGIDRAPGSGRHPGSGQHQQHPLAVHQPGGG